MQFMGVLIDACWDSAVRDAGETIPGIGAPLGKSMVHAHAMHGSPGLNDRSHR